MAQQSNMYGILPCMFCIGFLVCQIHHSLPLGPIQPSSPSRYQRAPWSIRLLYFPVRSASKRATTAGLHLVRRTSGLPSDEHVPPDSGGVQDRSPLPLLLAGLHHCAVHGLLAQAPETVHQVHLHLRLVLHLPV